MPHTIMIVEDDQKLHEYLQKIFINEGFAVWNAYDSAEGLAILEKKTPDLILLDLGLPNISGETLCKEVKEMYPEVKVIILTAKDRIDDVVEGFNIGADDYITKPFQTEELLARVNARLRTGNTANQILQVADLTLNIDTMDVKRGEKTISLTPQEFKLLHYLMANEGRVLTRDMILSKLWGVSTDVESRVVDVYIGYLRKKIDLNQEMKLIQSVRGFGYTIKASNQ